MKLDQRYLWPLLFVVLALFTLGFSHQGTYLNPTTLPAHDIATTYLPRLWEIKQAAAQGDYWHQWSPYMMSGMPYLIGSEFRVDYPLPTWLFIFSGIGPVMALKLTYIIDWILGALAMYLLGLSFGWKPRWAVLSGIVYMYNGYTLKLFVWGWLSSINAYVLAPIVILFFHKALTTKKWFLYTLLTAGVAALQIRAGADLKIFNWTALTMGILCLWYVFGKHWKTRAVKAGIAFAIAALLIGGLSMQRLLPAKEFFELSNRERNPWQITSSRQLPWSQSFVRLIEPKETFTDFQMFRPMANDHIGIIAFLLALAAIYVYRKERITWLFAAIALAGIILSTNFLNAYWFLWKYIPPFGGTRYLDRSLFLWGFGMALLAGLGLKAAETWGKTKGYKPIKVASIVIGLVILNLAVFNNDPVLANEWSDAYEAIKDNDALQWISQQERPFRIQTWETRGIDWGTDFYNVPLELEHIFSYTTIWHPTYWQYIGIANNQPAKLWGILNTKYVTSREQLNQTGLELIYTGQPCNTCFSDVEDFQKSWGPYVYENTLVAPRAFMPQKTALLVGDTDLATQVYYSLLLDDRFDARTSALLWGYSTLKDVPEEVLAAVNAVILTPGAVEQNDAPRLSRFKQQGGVLAPDILENEQQFTDARIAQVLAALNGSAKEVSFTRNGFDASIVTIPHAGFVIISEQYAIYPEWKSTQNQMQANGIITAVLAEPGNLTFKYSSKAYKIGTTISILTLLLVLALLILIRRPARTSTLSVKQ